MTFTGGMIMAPGVSAAPPAAVKESQAKTSLEVTVPADGTPVTYEIDGELQTIASGQTATIPAGATKINLPVGTLITLVVPSGGDAGPVKQQFVVSQPVTLDALTAEAVQANSGAITPVESTDIRLPSPTITGLIEGVRNIAKRSVNPFDALTVTDGN